MKIGIDIRLIGKRRTGDEVVFFNLVRELARIKTDHKFELFTDITDKETLEKISEQLGIVEKENFKIFSLQTSSKFAWNFWTLPQYLQKNPVDVYLTQYITPFFVSKKIHPHTKESGGWLWGNAVIIFLEKKYINWHNKHFGVGVKIVTIVHDISFNFFEQFIKFSDLFFLKTLIPLSLRRADKIIGVSEFTKNEIVKYYKINLKKVEFVHNSIGEEFLNEALSKKVLEKVREKYGLPEKFILYVGTLQPRKNIPQLIEAFARVTKRLKGTKLVICGNRGGHNFDNRIDEAVRKDNLESEVIFPGFVDECDKVAIFALAEVFVFPSLYEGFGIPVLEAMSQNVPVLASDIPSLKEIAEEGALYFDLSNLDDFAEKLYNISRDNELRSELIQAGKERISFFSWKKSAEKTLAILEKIGHN